MIQMNQLSTSDRQNFPLNSDGQNDGPIQDRTCTDIACFILFIMVFCTFLGLFIYGVYQGDPIDAFAVFNARGIKCITTSNTKVALFPDILSVKNAMCVSTCPNAGETVNCIEDDSFCTSNKTFTSQFATSQIFSICVPNVNNQLATFFSYQTYAEWAFDIERGYFLLLGSVGVSLILIILYICLLRSCTNLILWSSIFIIILITFIIGIFLIFEGVGIQISQFLPISLSQASKLSLLIAGGVLLGLLVIFIVIIALLHRKIQLGIAVVQTASIYLSQTCSVMFMPIINIFFILLIFAGLLIGFVFLYATGQRNIINPGDAFQTINFKPQFIVLLTVYGICGLWSFFWITGANNFVVTNSSCLWYFSNANSNNGTLCISIYWLLRYHIGTVALSSFINTTFFIFKVLADLFSVTTQQTDSKCIQFCSTCLTYILCVFQIFLRVLSQGTYVQVSMYSTNYCSSTCNSYQLLRQNTLKLLVTQQISVLVTSIGILANAVLIGFGAYFCQLYIEYFAKQVNDPLPITFIAVVIAFICSAIFLSLLGSSSSSIIQCFIIDQYTSQEKGGQAKYCNESLRLLLNPGS